MYAARSLALVSRMTGLRGLSMSPMTGMRQLFLSRPVMTTYNDIYFIPRLDPIDSNFYLKSNH